MVGWLLAILVGVSPGAAPPDGLEELRQLQRAFQRIAERVAPSVVALRSLRPGPSGKSADSRSGHERTGCAIWGAGSGVVVRADGLILTNEHVIHDAQQITVVLPGGIQYPARVKASDRRNDLAIIKIDADGLPVARLGDAATLRVGQWVVALGNPYGLGLDGQPSVSVGVVSALGRSLPTLSVTQGRSYTNMIQTTADINPGHSGGPLVDIEGRVVGLNTAVFTRTGLSEGVGFAIPINQRTKSLVARLTAGDQPACGYLGIWATAVTPNQARLTGLPPGGGVRVWRVESDSPAHRAGLRAGDIILRFNQAAVGNGEQLSRLVYQAIPGSSVALETLRADCRQSLHVNVGRRRSLEQLALQADP